MGLLDTFLAYKAANTPRNTRPRVSPAKVIDQGLLGGAIGRVPDNAQAMYQGLLNAPQELAQLGGKGSLESVNQAMRNPQQANPQQWMDKGMELTGMAPVGGLIGATVYHGSPHKFSKFDMSKIGTGEGAQAYGHGLYFAENPAVARSYRDKLAENDFKIDGKLIKENSVQYGLADMIDRHGSIDKAKEFIEKDIARLSKSYQEHGWDVFKDSLNTQKNLLDNISKFDSDMRRLQIEKQGAFYKVDIPDEAIPKMLDWDKPLSEQGAEVQNILSKNYKIEPYTADGLSPNLDGAGIYKALMGFEGMPPSDKLKQLGIPGIRYLDGNSRGTGGTSNYVLFDDTMPRILEVNGQPTGLLSWADEAKKAKK